MDKNDNVGCLIFLLIAMAAVIGILHSWVTDAGAQAPDYGYGCRCQCVICWYLSGERHLPETWQWHHALYGQWVSALEATVGYWEPAGGHCWEAAYGQP